MNMLKKKQKDIVILMIAVAVLLCAALLIPSNEAMASSTSPTVIAGKATDIIPLSPGETVRIPFRPEMELLTEASFYLLHFPEEEEGDFLVSIKDGEGQTLFETKKPLRELPHEDFGRFPIGISLDTEQNYICEVMHTGFSPDIGLRLVVMDATPAWFCAGPSLTAGAEIEDAFIMNMMFFRPRVLYLLTAKLLLMSLAAVCIVRQSVILCPGGIAA